jgi:uncharacterized membrane protein YidH (DUF202 family)
MRKAGRTAFILIVVGLVMLVVALLASPLFVIIPNQTEATQTASGIVALVLLIGGALLLIAGLIVRLRAPKSMPDTQYDHDLPNN